MAETGQTGTQVPLSMQSTGSMPEVPHGRRAYLVAVPPGTVHVALLPAGSELERFCVPSVEEDRHCVRADGRELMGCEMPSRCVKTFVGGSRGNST